MADRDDPGKLERMELTRSGDVLAGRYHLTDLLSEARDGRFWRAEDRILGRPVAIHVLDANDERAPRLAAAARTSAAVNDAHLLRVLDVATTDTIAYVVNEWGSGTSLDNLLAAEGPLPPRRAAWIAAEVTELLAKAHHLGHAHGRLSPENVLLDDLGAVRIIGFAVEAALYGEEPDAEGAIEGDCVDAAAVLYAALTGKWAGRSSSRLPAAPTDHGRPLRPRQVRAGVPRVLDDLCDRVLCHPADSGPVPTDEQHGVLASYVGDAAPATTFGRTGLNRTVLGTIPVTPATDVPGETPNANGTTEVVPAAGQAPEPARPGDADLATAAMKAPSADAPGTEEDPPDAEPAPTEPGIPAFDDDWSKPREDPAPPPPPLEPPPPKPLFADEPRRPREQRDQSASAQPTSSQSPRSDQFPAQAPEPARSHRPAQVAPEPTGHEPGYWPWAGSGAQPLGEPELAAEPTAVPGRNWLRLAIGVAVAAVLIICLALAISASQGHGPFAGGDNSASPSPSKQTVAPRPIKGLGVKDFDPYGDPPYEDPDLVHLVIDGNKSTTWRTSTYKQQFGPGGLKPGVGLILDLKHEYAVDRLHLDLVGEPTRMSVYVGDRAPTEAPTGTPAGSGSLGTSGDIRLNGSPKGRYVTIWITQLPPVGSEFRAEVAEVSVSGSPLG